VGLPGACAHTDLVDAGDIDFATKLTPGSLVGPARLEWYSQNHFAGSGLSEQDLADEDCHVCGTRDTVFQVGNRVGDPLGERIAVDLAVATKDQALEVAKRPHQAGSAAAGGPPAT
jgi:hypothetical protein